MIPNVRCILAAGGVGLRITRVILANRQGWLLPAGRTMSHLSNIVPYRLVMGAVYRHGTKILGGVSKSMLRKNRLSFWYNKQNTTPDG